MKKITMLLVAMMLLLACATIGIARDNFILDVEYYPPSIESGNVAIMFFGGAEGGMPVINSELFTSKGYPCLKVGYFGTAHTPDQLEMIPLEYFEKAIQMFQSQPEVKGKKIVLFGNSKGGELALLLASRYKEIAGVIARVPCSVVDQGFGTSSSWSYRGQPLPFLPYDEKFDFNKVMSGQWLESFKRSLAQTDVVEKAVIEVERINGPVLIITGQEDKMWPSSQMGDMIVKRLKDHEFPHWYKHYAYENAGHSFNEKTLMEGTKYGNNRARIDSVKRIFAFLGRLSESDGEQNQLLRNSKLDSEKTGPKEISIAPEILKQYVGTYKLAPDFDITVTLEGRRLITRVTGQDKIPVYAMSETKFFNKVEDATVEFFKDDKGAVSHLSIFETVAAKTDYEKGPADIDGTWIATADGPDGNPLETTYEFEAAGEKLTGSVNTKLGGGPFSEGKIEGDKISFVVSYGETTIEWNGTVSEDEIHFTQRNGERVTQFTARRAVQPASITFKDKVDVGGYKLNICCFGKGKPAVIVDAGKGEPAVESGSWKAVVSAIAPTTQVCLYDRAGLGLSDRAPEQNLSGRTSQDMVKDLHTLLEKAGIPAPYILAGHSLGGYNVRLYAGQYSKEVAGVVLVDSPHPDIWSKFSAALPPERPDDSESLRTSRYQWSRFSADPPPERKDDSGSPGAARSMEDRLDPNDPEKFDFATSGAQITASGALGDLPLAVISCAPGTSFFPDFPADLSDKLMRVWQDTQIDLAGLSSNSTHTIASHAGHYIQAEEPQLVVDAILDVMGRAKK